MAPVYGLRIIELLRYLNFERTLSILKRCWYRYPINFGSSSNLSTSIGYGKDIAVTSSIFDTEPSRVGSACGKARLRIGFFSYRINPDRNCSTWMPSGVARSIRVASLISVMEQTYVDSALEKGGRDRSGEKGLERYSFPIISGGTCNLSTPAGVDRSVIFVSTVSLFVDFIGEAGRV